MFGLSPFITGVRRGEIAGLRWEDVDLDNAQITIRNTIVEERGDKEKGIKTVLRFDTPTSESSRRPMALPKVVVDALREHKAKDTFGNLVFCSSEGTPLWPRNLDRTFKGGLKMPVLTTIRLHDLRHSYGSHYLANGSDLMTLKHNMGHADIRTTQIYTHTFPDNIRKSADIIV